MIGKKGRASLRERVSPIKCPRRVQLLITRSSTDRRDQIGVEDFVSRFSAEIQYQHQQLQQQQQQQQQQRNEWVRLVEYLTVENGTMFEILIWVPLILMALYIIFIEGGPLVIPKS